MKPRLLSTDKTVETLSPEPTKWDLRVLAALPPRSGWDDPVQWLTAWQVAERLREDDVGLVRRTLRGLAHLDHGVMSRDYDHRQKWARIFNPKDLR